jgi:hypothetical protein
MYKIYIILKVVHNLWFLALEFLRSLKIPFHNAAAILKSNQVSAKNLGYQLLCSAGYFDCMIARSPVMPIL